MTNRYLIIIRSSANSSISDVSSSAHIGEGGAFNMGDLMFEEWEELAKDYKQLEAVNETYLRKLKEISNLQQTCLKHLKHQRYRLNIMNKTINQLEKNGKDALTNLKNGIMKREAELQLIEQSLPKQSGTYLKIVLGNVDVSFLNKKDKFRYKDEFEKFKHN